MPHWLPRQAWNAHAVNPEAILIGVVAKSRLCSAIQVTESIGHRSYFRSRVKNVLMPSALENAMSMQAQAERERQARVILGDAECQIAEEFAEAAKSYEHNPWPSI